MKPDLVLDAGGCVGVDPAVLREIPVAHWLPSDCRPMSRRTGTWLRRRGRSSSPCRGSGRNGSGLGGTDAFYVPHGISFDVWKPAENRAALREARGIDPAAYLIGVNAANNDAIRKAAPEMMLAFARFRATHPDAILALHTGVHCDGGQDLEAVAENLGITDAVMVVDQYRYTAGLIAKRTCATGTARSTCSSPPRTRRDSGCPSSKR